MPTFSLIALDRILEPTTNEANNNSNNSNYNGCRNNSLSVKNKFSFDEGKRKVCRAVISPALYTTPEKTPIPDSPTSFNPSPYVVDHKRRAPVKRISEARGFEPRIKEDQKEGRNCSGSFVDKAGRECLKSDGVDGKYLNLEGKEVMMNENREFGVEGSGLDDSSGSGFVTAAPKEEREGDCDEFLEMEDWKSVASSSDAESRSRRSFNYSTQTGQSEYFDAVEDISLEDVGSQASESYNPLLLNEVDFLKCNLSIETERRKMVEEALSRVRNQWQEIAKKFSSIGLSFPSTKIDSACQAVEEDPVDEICKRLVIARFVAGAVGRGSARAEVEQEMEAVLECKNREIARLRDKLQYYEVVNHEMSQRNQEAIEVARRRRRMQKKRQRWLWGSLVVAITIGTTAVVHSYLPRKEMGSLRAPCVINADTVNNGTASKT